MANATFWVVAATSVVVGLFMLGTGQFLAAAIVGLSACMCLLVLGLSKSARHRTGTVASVSQQRRNGLAIMVTGLATTLVGAILSVVWPGTIANFLMLWATPGMILGGAVVYWRARSQQSKSGEQRN